MEKDNKQTDYDLPKELDLLLDGIEIDEKIQMKDYKFLRNQMYASRIL